ncbi:MAG: glycosyltransferase family 2 protein [Bacteroidetes bacterium]|nr:glycosyltransferase family 2 protein [Bacteroidota bacterium]MDA1121058.1 glycosyltransferase family 2 protein [Bacteroidota bacterium]
MSGLSVIIPTFNRTKFLTEAVISVLEQTVLPHEILIINDGSSPEFEHDLEKIASLSPLIELINNDTQKGVSFSRNQGIEAASGAFISFLDDDDILEMNFIKRGIAEFNENEKADVLISNTDILESGSTQSHGYKHFRKLMRNKSTLVGDEVNDASFFLTHCPMIHSFIFKNPVIKQFQFPEDLKYGEDMYLWIEMVDSEINFKRVDWIGGYFRLHKGNVSSHIDIGEKINFYEKIVNSGFDLNEHSSFLVALRGFYWSLRSGSFSKRYFWSVIKHPVWSLKAIWKRAKIHLHH